MVMATGNSCRPFGTGSLSQEAAEGAEARDNAAAALHDRLVAFVHSLSSPHEPRSGVWVEHSYALAQGATQAPSSNVRVLLAPPPSPPDVPVEEVDIEKEDPPPPSPPEPRRPTRSQRARSPSDTEDEDVEEDWEPRVTALAPTAAHATLAEVALDTLRRFRLARLAVGRAGSREYERLGARRLRHAIVTAATALGPQAQKPGPWLHATLLAYMSRPMRRLYDVLTSELRRAAPRLAERIMGARAPPPRREPLAVVGPPVGAEAPVWLIWLGSGSDRLDRRWRRRLGTMLYTRVLPAPTVGPARPDAWCAAVAGAMRAALADTLTEAGERAVILGGASMGATLCIALASGVTGAGVPGGAGGVRGLLLLSPPLLTAEGPRDMPDDPLAEIRVPLLLVSGSGASASWRGAARTVCRARPGRRLLEVHGADDALRASAAYRRKRRLPQHALDAAIADECARWALETVDKTHDLSPPRSPPPAPRSPPRVLRSPPRAPRTPPRSPPRGPTRVLRSPPRTHRSPPRAHRSPTRTLRSPPRTQRRRAPAPAPVPPAVPSPVPSTAPSPILVEDEAEHAATDASEETTKEAGEVEELSEGRVVTRGRGSTPLKLLPPRQGTEAPAPTKAFTKASTKASAKVSTKASTKASTPAATPLAAADIMRLPIVFADDEGVPPVSHYQASEPPIDVEVTVPENPVTVTSGRSVTSAVTWRRGAGTFTRVIVASRGGAVHGGTRVAARAVTRVAARGVTRVAARGVTRPLLLRRAVRLLPHNDD